MECVLLGRENDLFRSTMGLGFRQTWVQVPALLFAACVMGVGGEVGGEGKWLHPFESECPYYDKREYNSYRERRKLNSTWKVLNSVLGVAGAQKTFESKETNSSTASHLLTLSKSPTRSFKEWLIRCGLTRAVLCSTSHPLSSRQVFTIRELNHCLQVSATEPGTKSAFSSISNRLTTRFLYSWDCDVFVQRLHVQNVWNRCQHCKSTGWQLMFLSTCSFHPHLSFAYNSTSRLRKDHILPMLWASVLAKVPQLPQ